MAVSTDLDDTFLYIAGGILVGLVVILLCLVIATLYLVYQMKEQMKDLDPLGSYSNKLPKVQPKQSKPYEPESLRRTPPPQMDSMRFRDENIFDMKDRRNDNQPQNMRFNTAPQTAHNYSNNKKSLPHDDKFVNDNYSFGNTFLSDFRREQKPPNMPGPSDRDNRFY